GGGGGGCDGDADGVPGSPDAGAVSSVAGGAVASVAGGAVASVAGEPPPGVLTTCGSPRSHPARAIRQARTTSGASAPAELRWDSTPRCYHSRRAQPGGAANDRVITSSSSGLEFS